MYECVRPLPGLEASAPGEEVMEEVVKDEEGAARSKRRAHALCCFLGRLGEAVCQRHRTLRTVVDGHYCKFINGNVSLAVAMWFLGW